MSTNGKDKSERIRIRCSAATESGACRDAKTFYLTTVDGIWLASFMHYDLGYFDLEQKTLQPLDNPFGTRLSPMS
jgi:hypothetical protein